MNDCLRTGCKTCAGTYSDSAEMRISAKDGVYLPWKETFKDCEYGESELCTAACPGRSIDFDEINRFVFGKQAEDLFLGNYAGCYIGHAIWDGEAPKTVSSGGMVTALMTLAMEEHLIDNAVVTRMRRDRPLEPEVFIARTREELVSSAGSKYVPVPVNATLRSVLRKDETFGIVGLPCHMAGIRKAEMASGELRKNLILHMGLFCSHNVNFFGTQFLLEKLHIREDEITRLDYRGSGWPGGMSIGFRDGREKFIPMNSYYPLFAPFFFTPTRCLLCSDGTNELADISFGDAWLRKLVDRGRGQSLIIARSQVGEQLLQEAIVRRRVKVSKVSRRLVIKAQRGMLLRKKKKLKAYIAVAKLFGMKVPEFNTRLLEPDPTDYVRALPIVAAIHVIPRRVLSKQLSLIPLSVLRSLSRL